MKNVKTRAQIVLCAVTLSLSLGLAAGTALAWFTDNITSGKNRIQAGTLDVAVSVCGLSEDSTGALTVDAADGAPVRFAVGADKTPVSAAPVINDALTVGTYFGKLFVVENVGTLSASVTASLAVVTDGLPALRFAFVAYTEENGAFTQVTDWDGTTDTVRATVAVSPEQTVYFAFVCCLDEAAEGDMTFDLGLTAILPSAADSGVGFNESIVSAGNSLSAQSV